MSVSKIDGGRQIEAGTITNTEVDASAGIGLSKLAATTASKALVSDGSGFVSASSVTSTELGYVSGVTSAIQTQIDNIAAGLSWKDAVLTSDADLSAATISYSDPTLTISVLTAGSSLGQLDGVEPVVGSRVLILDAGNAGTGADAAMNGIWEITGGTTTTLTMDRATDMDATGEFSSAAVFIQQGSTNADTGFTQTNEVTTVDTTAVNFTQFTGVSPLTAGDGIDITANAVIVDITDLVGTGIEDDGSNNFRLATQGNGIAGGAGSTLSVDSDTETGSNIQGANITANGVGLDINAIAGTGIEADGSANLRLATQGNGISGGAGSTLSVDSDTETGGNIQGANITANGVGVDIAAIAGTGLAADGSANLQVDGTVVTDTRQVTRETPSGLINGSNTSYSLANTPQAGTEMVFLRGILQEPGAGNDYTISGATITYLSAPLTGDKLVVSYTKD